MKSDQDALLDFRTGFEEGSWASMPPEHSQHLSRATPGLMKLRELAHGCKRTPKNASFTWAGAGNLQHFTKDAKAAMTFVQGFIAERLGIEMASYTVVYSFVRVTRGAQPETPQCDLASGYSLMLNIGYSNQYIDLGTNRYLDIDGSDDDPLEAKTVPRVEFERLKLQRMEGVVWRAPRDHAYVLTPGVFLHAYIVPRQYRLMQVRRDPQECEHHVSEKQRCEHQWCDYCANKKPRPHKKGKKDAEK